MKTLPKARTSEIVEQELGKELLIYDLTTDKAYCLNETSAKIFNACDGKTMFDDLKRRYNFTDDLIHFALAELKARELLEDYKSDHFTGLSRREIIRKVGRASLVALPVVAGLTAPHAAQAASSTCAGQACTSVLSCSVPCRFCNGSGTCSSDGTTCNNLGNSCGAATAGICNPGGLFNTCSAGGAPCFSVGSTCYDVGRCVGTGTCA